MIPYKHMHRNCGIWAGEYLVYVIPSGAWFVYQGPGWIGPYWTIVEMEIGASAL